MIHTLRKHLRLLLFVTAAVLLIAGMIVILVSTGGPGKGTSEPAATESPAVSIPQKAQVTDGEHELEDLSGNKVVLDEELPTGATVKKMNITDTKDSFDIDRIGLHAPMKKMNVVNGVATPPTLDAVFTLRGYGDPGDDNPKGTSYIVTHSVNGGNAPGNKMMDVSKRGSTVVAGDTIRAHGEKYVVEKVFLSPKTETPKNSDIWEQKDGRLIVMTCLQNADGSRSQNNIVIQAQHA